MDVVQVIQEFCLNEGAVAGALGAFLILCGSHFAVLDIGVRKNTPLTKEPYPKQALFVLVGWLVAASFTRDQPNLPFLVYFSVGAGWVYILRAVISSAQIIGAAITKRNKLIAENSLGNGS